MDKTARPTGVKAGLTDRWEGVEVKSGSCLQLRFERLDLLPF
jgi:hypothetical protein